MIRPRFTCIILQNKQGKVLLSLRDDKPTIPCPNQWHIIGGGVEDSETPEQAIKRELMEEIEFEIKDFKLFKKYNWPEKDEWLFHAKVNLIPKNINLHEGQKIDYFSKEEIEEMNLAFHDNQMIEDFFK